MSSDPYSGQVRDLFANPRHGGNLDDGIDGIVNEQGVRVRLTMRDRDGQIDTLRFQAWGCPHLIAACEAFCTAYEGRAIEELAAFSGAGLMQSLAVPVEKTGRILVLEDAVRSLGANACQSSPAET